MGKKGDGKHRVLRAEEDVAHNGMRGFVGERMLLRYMVLNAVRDLCSDDLDIRCQAIEWLEFETSESWTFKWVLDMMDLDHDYLMQKLGPYISEARQGPCLSVRLGEPGEWRRIKRWEREV